MAVNCAPLSQFSDRLYFTTFNHPVPKAEAINRRHAHSAITIRSSNIGRVLVSPPESPQERPFYFFTFDDTLVYNSFYMDWGPLNLAMVYKACIFIHELLQDEELSSHRLVLYSSSEPEFKANAALLISLYALIVLRMNPWEAFRPIAELEFMAFRDAGRGSSDFNLTIHDCLWGMYKAVQHGLCDMNTFSVEDYEFYEKVENGDWNWITPGFLAFASPSDSVYIKQQKSGVVSTTALTRKLPTPFLNCLNYFEERNVKLVVRLNNILYDRQAFVDRGMEHVELYFDDGTNPTDEIVRNFINMADRVIGEGGVVAVHCKAGLGRTGTLIGAYLIWKYGFTANEAIAFMRIARPGSVVGPQQQYMYLKQMDWCRWAAADEIRHKEAAQVALAAVVPAVTHTQPGAARSTPVKTPVTPPAEETAEVVERPLVLPSIPPAPPVTPSRHVTAGEAATRAAVTPGQPRKTPRGKRTKADIADDSEEDDEISALPLNYLRPKTSRLPRTTVTKKKTPQTEHKRSATRSGIENNMVPKNNPVNGKSRPPLKMQRLADGTSNKRHLAQDPPSPSPVRRVRPISPTASRLPQLTTGKRALALLNGAMDAKIKKVTTGNDWMSTANAANVVAPGSKSLLRPARRRRSSFSAVDIVA